MFDAGANDTITLLTQLVERNGRAAVGADTREMDDILADDWVNINPDGQPASKLQILASFASGAVKTEAIETEDLDIRHYGDAAVIRGLYRVKAEIRGERVDYRIRRTDFCIARARRWQIVSSHVTRIAERQGA